MAEDTKQFVTFYLGKEKYGIEIGLVQEIIRVPSLTKTPLAPPYVEGLANLRGTILPVVNGRLRFGLEPKDINEASRVVIIDFMSEKIGLLVDRISDVVTVSGRDIEIKDADDSDYIEGVAKADGAASLVLLVDVRKLYPRITKSKKISQDYGAASEQKQVKEDVEEQHQFVSFRIGGEDYALDIMDVQEIVHLPGSVSQVPGAPYYCEGLATLRGKLLPLIKLSSLLGHEASVLDERARAIVVNLKGTGGNLTVGFAVDSVSEVLRVSGHQIEALPPVLVSDSDSSFISGVCNFEGRKIVKLLNLREVFSESDYEALRFEAEELHKGSDEASSDDAEVQYVTFSLAGQEYGAPIAQVQEIIRVPKIFKVPRAPEFVEGVVNIRGQVVPVVDLRMRFGLAKERRDEASRIVVADIGGIRTGLVVDAVKEVLKLPARDIDEVPELIITEEAGFLSGIGKARKGERILILVDFTRLLNRREEKELRAFGEEADQSTGG